MTTDTQGKPLYSDSYIAELIDRRVKAYGDNAKVGARSVAHEIRNTYEHRIAQLEAALATAYAELEKYKHGIPFEGEILDD